MSWAVAITQPQTENRVASDVSALGFQVFNPRIKVLAIRQGRRVHRTEPMFRRYLMIRMCEQIFEIFTVRHLVDLIRTEPTNNPALVADREIDAIKSRCTGDDILIMPKPTRFMQGELVRPKSGALIDLIGKYETSSGKRELATFHLMGRDVIASFKRGDLAAA